MWPQGSFCYGSNVICGKALHKHSVKKQFFFLRATGLKTVWRIADVHSATPGIICLISGQQMIASQLYTQRSSSGDWNVLCWRIWLPFSCFLIIKAKCQPLYAFFFFFCAVQYLKTVSPLYHCSSVKVSSTAKVPHQTASNNFCVFNFFVELVVQFDGRKTIFKLLSNCTAPSQKDYASFNCRYNVEWRTQGRIAHGEANTQAGFTEFIV